MSRALKLFRRNNINKTQSQALECLRKSTDTHIEMSSESLRRSAIHNIHNAALEIFGKNTYTHVEVKVWKVLERALIQTSNLPCAEE